MLAYHGKTVEIDSTNLPAVKTLHLELSKVCLVSCPSTICLACVLTFLRVAKKLDSASLPVLKRVSRDSRRRCGQRESLFPAESRCAAPRTQQRFARFTFFFEEERLFLIGLN